MDIYQYNVQTQKIHLTEDALMNTFCCRRLDLEKLLRKQIRGDLEGEADHFKC